MVEPQYDQRDADIFYLMQEKRELQKQRDMLLAALHKVPLFGLTDDALGWRCAGCGSVSGINEDGSTRDETCVRDCYVPIVEAAINGAEGK